MTHHLQDPLDAGQLAAVASALARVPAFVPDPAWNAGATGWKPLAEAGAAAARAGDDAALRQSCKGCHKAFRRDYKAKFRTRSVP